VALVRKRTIPTNRPPLVSEVSANFNQHNIKKIKKEHYMTLFCGCRNVTIVMILKNSNENQGTRTEE
jgi:hypothetical protein